MNWCIILKIPPPLEGEGTMVLILDDLGIKKQLFCTLSPKNYFTFPIKSFILPYSAMGIAD